MSLVRALVVNAKINILDEATASVDYETDHKIQMTIARLVLPRIEYLFDSLAPPCFREFKDRTILCIARKYFVDCGMSGFSHFPATDRLRTIISYDRICVLDAGNVVEMDSPEALFHIPGGIFRSMCDRSSISLEDIQTAQRNEIK